MEGVLEGAPTGAGVEGLDPAQAELIERVRAAIGQRQAAPADDTQSGTLCVRGSGSKDFLGGPLHGEVLSTSCRPWLTLPAQLLLLAHPVLVVPHITWVALVHIRLEH